MQGIRGQSFNLVEKAAQRARDAGEFADRVGLGLAGRAVAYVSLKVPVAFKRSLSMTAWGLSCIQGFQAWCAKAPSLLSTTSFGGSVCLSLHSLIHEAARCSCDQSHMNLSTQQ